MSRGGGIRDRGTGFSDSEFFPPRRQERQVRPVARRRLWAAGRIIIFFAAPSTEFNAEPSRRARTCFASLRRRSGHALREIFRIFGCGSAALGTSYPPLKIELTVLHPSCILPIEGRSGSKPFPSTGKGWIGVRASRICLHFHSLWASVRS